MKEYIVIDADLNIHAYEMNNKNTSVMYNPYTQSIILNSMHPKYESICRFVKDYFKMHELRRDLLRRKASPSIIQILVVLDIAIECREVAERKWIFYMTKNTCELTERITDE